jgi:hypothetical protein
MSLSIFPKDITRIIYSYIYRDVSEEIPDRVDFAKDISYYNERRDVGGVIDLSYVLREKETLRSCRCNLHTKSKEHENNVIEKILHPERDSLNDIMSNLSPLLKGKRMRNERLSDTLTKDKFWKRTVGHDGYKFIGRSFGLGLCQKLLLCQDVSARWNEKFGDLCKYSIINGVVYHYVKRGDNKFNLVPVFESEHCWQDMGLMFSRLQNSNESTLIPSSQSKYRREKDCIIF